LELTTNLAKGAIIQMTRAMAAHHGKENIRVNCIAPGMVFTPMVRWRGIDENMRKARIGQNLMGKEGTAWDVGYAILFLCSREASWITGLIMPVDGGVGQYMHCHIRSLADLSQTTAGKADRPALKEDTLAGENVGARSKL
jgi:enoyl-[acyl-carrier-protein] reductase (NADH)